MISNVPTRGRMPLKDTSSMPISTSPTTSMRARPQREDQAVSKASFETRSFKNGVKVLVSVQYSASRHDVLQRARDDQRLRRLLEEDVRKFGLGRPPDDVWIENRSACVVLCWRRPADRAEVRPARPTDTADLDDGVRDLSPTLPRGSSSSSIRRRYPSRRCSLPAYRAHAFPVEFELNDH
jgi:hypothetical protein